MKGSPSVERRCPVCDGQVWIDLIASNTGIIMTGDQRIGPGDLNKVLCTECGIGANKYPFTKQEIETLYGEAYELNTLGKEEHIFFTESGEKARSEVFCEWIAPHINNPSGTILEIGCGEGMLLQRIKNRFPNASIKGIDGSSKAVQLAKRKGLNVNQKLIHHANDRLEPADTILLINVIEHIQDLEGVLTTLKNSINPGGRIIFCLPIQDFGGYDIVFAEHVWHFSTGQFEHLLQKNGLNTIHNDSNHPINHGIGLFICEASKKTMKTQAPRNTTLIPKVWQNWNRRFEDLNKQLLKFENLPIAVFGSSEVLTLLLCYSELRRANIEVLVDENKEKRGTFKHDIRIVDIADLFEYKFHAVVIATHPNYHNNIKNKLLQVTSVPIISFE